MMANAFDTERHGEAFPTEVSLNRAWLFSFLSQTANPTRPATNSRASTGGSGAGTPGPSMTKKPDGKTKTTASSRPIQAQLHPARYR